MSADTVVRARIDSETKERATAALEAMGLSVSDAIRLLMLRIADEQRLPFAVQVPNSMTAKALEDWILVGESGSIVLTGCSRIWGSDADCGPFQPV